MEFIIRNNLEKELPSVIDFNYEQIKNELTERLEYYNSVVVTEDTIQPAKKERANLNKLKKAIDDKRKEVKAQCMAPYEEFERKVKDLVSLIDKPIGSIDLQLKVFEDSKKQEKKERIEAYYDEYAGELKGLITLDRIWDSKWLNSTCSLASATQEIHDILDKGSNDLKIIKAMKLPYEQNMIDVYLRTLDMGSALSEKNRLEEQAERLKVLEDEKSSAQEQPPAREQSPAQPTESPIALPEEPKTIKVIFYNTSEAFRREMKLLTEKHGIKYGGIK